MPANRLPPWEYKKSLFEQIDYFPNSYQEKGHREAGRYIAVFGGERAGKSRWTSAEILARAPFTADVDLQTLCVNRPGRILLVGQEYANTAAEFEYLLNDLKRLGNLGPTVKRPTIGPCYLQIMGAGHLFAEVFTLSAKDGPHELTGKGMPYDVIGLLEAGLLRSDIFMASRGRVAQTRGSVLLSGTLWDDTGWYSDLWREWEGANPDGGTKLILPTYANTTVFPGGENDPEILALKRSMPAEEFARRVLGILVASPARIYTEWSPQRHLRGDSLFDPDERVWITVDAGYNPSAYAVLAAQTKKRLAYFDSDLAAWRWLDNEERPEDEDASHFKEITEVRIFDEVYEHKKLHADIIEICKLKPWWGNVTRVVGGHETGAHGAQESTAEIWQKLTGHFMEAAPSGILPGIMQVKTFLLDPETKLPRLQVSADCVNLAREFSSYRRRSDRMGNPVSDDPEDANNDCLDALRNLIVQQYGWIDYGNQAKITYHHRNPVAHLRGRRFR